jgi:hypothetical protein
LSVQKIEGSYDPKVRVLYGDEVFEIKNVGTKGDFTVLSVNSSQFQKCNDCQENVEFCDCDK